MYFFAGVLQRTTGTMNILVERLRAFSLRTIRCFHNYDFQLLLDLERVLREVVQPSFLRCARPESILELEIM